MPLYFWGDAGNRRYHDSYFDMYPGVWRHGDWLRITPRGGAIIYGRSDATINRHGIRMGTAELYSAVEAPARGASTASSSTSSTSAARATCRSSWCCATAWCSTRRSTRRLKDAIKAGLSARHVPNEIFQVASIPRTLSGKKMELPVKKLLMGTPPEQVFKLDAMANADSVAWFSEFARRRAGAQEAAR